MHRAPRHVQRSQSDVAHFLVDLTFYSSFGFRAISRGKRRVPADAPPSPHRWLPPSAPATRCTTHHDPAGLCGHRPESGVCTRASPRRPLVGPGRRVVAQTCVLPAQAPQEAHVPGAQFHGSGQRVPPGAPLPRNLGTFRARPEAPHVPSDSLCSELPRRAPCSLSAFETLRAVRGSGPGSCPSWVGLPGRTVVYNRCTREPVAHLWFLQEQMLSFRLTRPFRS